MKKETKKTIQEFRNELTNLAQGYCNEASPIRAMAYATAAIQFNGEEKQTQKLYEMNYWAHYQIGNFYPSKQYFDMAMNMDQLNEKYLKDYKYYYKLPTINVVIGKFNENFDAITEHSEYQKDKIKTTPEVDDSYGEWILFLPYNYIPSDYEFLILMKVASDNSKKCITFDMSRECWAIERKEYNKLKEKGVTDFVAAMDGMMKYMHVGESILNKK